MEEYREMYLRLARETLRAVELLTQAQLECEEIYINAGIRPLPLEGKSEASTKD